MMFLNKSMLLLTNEAISLCSRFDNYDDYQDWCFDNGIFQLPSSGSKFANKLGLTQKDIDRTHRFDIIYQLGKLSDWLLRFEIPLLALIAKRILYVQSIAIEFKYRKFDLNEDLEL